MDEAVEILANYKQYSCAPELCAAMHNAVKNQTGIDDPYGEVKSKDIREALKLEPVIKKFVMTGDDFLLNLLKASATGNIMDSALYSNLNIEECLLEEMKRPFAVCHISCPYKSLIHGFILQCDYSKGEFNAWNLAKYIFLRI